MPWHESIIEAELAKTKVLVNATSIGLTADESPIPAEILHPELLVLDLIYAKTRLLRDAAAAGCVTADGELMLLHQGAAAFNAVDRAAGAARGHGRGAGRRPGKGLRSAEGEPAADASGGRPGAEPAAG